MTIDDSGRWWVGSQSGDIRPYLEAYADAYEVDEFGLCGCKCGSEKFLLKTNEDAAQKTCADCGQESFICDSEEYWDEASADGYVCTECNSEQANIGVGFSLYPDREAIRWLYLGVRCASCGVLGCIAGWKIGYSPSLHLIESV
ncbi:hypothetical protein G6N74_13505 [Mesorhizobium sp. CGMCC 1.15528]|uniref:Uncharacterized protein n=1 Tax=Mesorhizobium zhangyense TaxID=1776730 RepID=A0A7C9R7I9_9HYPH|nr:hypothetical protein [Mesorhizobium zhangyense]NGN42081.1 hypothetical protein [Mesorhizobium zhangyense]